MGSPKKPFVVHLSRGLEFWMTVLFKSWILGCFCILVGWPFPVWAEPEQEVKGRYCYTYGDEETPAQGKKKALAFARERAVESHQVFISNKTRIENFQLKEDLLQSISAGMLKNVTIQEETEEGRTVCVKVVAQIAPNLMEEEIARRLEQRQLKDEVIHMLDNFEVEKGGEEPRGLTIWLNKSDGLYQEGDTLIVYVRSEQDRYLKLDYFQADGEVVHLVPNLYRGQAFVKKDTIYEFGGPQSPEQFLISPPFGDETIKAITSVHPFPKEFQSPKKFSESKTYLNNFKRGLAGRKRGVIILSGATAPLYTRSREEIEHRKNLGLEGK
jgi:hypothetical protein